MKQPKISKDKLLIIELVAVIIIAIIIFVGIVCEILDHTGHTYWIIPDLREFTKVVLQIQAGVSTLAVAILALISGMSGDEIYGISVTQYYMRIRMRVFKQHIVIIAAVSMVFLGVVFELFELYNLVFSAFFCGWVLICISVISILSVFTGRRNWKREIKSYLATEIDSPKPNYSVIVQFLDSCKPGQDNCDWKDQKELLSLSLNSLLKDNSREAIEILNSNYCELVAAHLQHSESWEVKRGITLLQEIYEEIWLFTIKNTELGYGSAGTLELYSNLYEDCKIALEHLYMYEIEECFDYEWFFETVARVDSYYMKADQEKFKNTCKKIEWLSQYMGYLIRKKTLDAPLSEYDMNYWGKALKDQRFSSYNVPVESRDVFLMHRCKLYLGYSISLIIDGHIELFEKFYFESHFHQIKRDRQQLIYRLAVACYLYYIAEVESQHLVPQDAKRCADAILCSRTFKGQFTALIEHGGWENDADFFQKNCEEILEELLTPYELFKDGQVKRLVIAPTVQLFYIFIQNYITRHRVEKLQIRNDFEKIQSQILNYFGDGQRDRTKKAFRRLYELLFATPVGINIEEKADALFYNWEKRITEQLKEEKIKKAAESQNTFENSNIGNVLRADTKEHLIDHFKDIFGCLIDQTIEDSHEIRFVLMKFTSDTDYFLTEKSLHELYDHLDGIFVDYVSSHLYKVNAVSTYDRSDKDDFEFLDDMRKDGVDLLVGDEYELRSKDYMNWKEVDAFHKECECIFVSGTDSALAIHQNTLKIAIRDISVSVFDSSLERDNDVEFIEETGMYKIRLLNDMTGTFTADEAQDYIKKQKKVSTISVKVTIRTSKPKLGYIVEGTYKD